MEEISTSEVLGDGALVEPVDTRTVLFVGAFWLGIGRTGFFSCS